MTMQVLWETHERTHTRFGFYFDENSVKFEYSGPFDQDTGEWLNARGTFRYSDFAHTLKTLQSQSHAEIKGAAGETLRLRILPTGTVSLDFNGGPSNNILNLDLGIPPRDLFRRWPQ